MSVSLERAVRPVAPPPQELRRRPVRRRPVGVLWWSACLVIAGIFVFPLVMVLLTSVKTPQEAVAVPPSYLPHRLSWGNFANLSSTGHGLATYLGNSVLVSAATVAMTLVLGTAAGYGLARIRFAGRNAVFLLLLAPIMVPVQALLTPLYVTLLHLHLRDSLLGLACIYTMSQVPFATFVMRNAFASIPAELEEAAWVDGCGIVSAGWRVGLRLAAPGLATVALFAFFTAWNEFLAALVMLSTDSKLTVPVLLQNLVTGQFGTIDWGMLQVGVLVTSLPCVLIFLILQRYYVEGLLAGSVKS